MEKAKTVGDALGLPVLADDSGLCVDLLDGAPGVYSARYAGEGAADADNNEKLLSELESRKLGEDTEQPLLSPARFVCSLVLYDPATGEKLESYGTVEGFITSKPPDAAVSAMIRSSIFQAMRRPWRSSVWTRSKPSAIAVQHFGT